MKNIFYFTLLLCSVSFAKAQNIPAFVKSTLVLVSEDKSGKALKFSIENAYMLLNTSSGDFTIECGPLWFKKRECKP